MPKTDFLAWCVDVLASRYGWSKGECLEELYWEDFWEYVVLAANFTAEEKNADLRFQFMLHADKKSARKWRDLPIPFPPLIEREGKSIDGISQLPSHLQKVVYRPD